MNKKILLVAIGLLFVFTAFAKDCPPNSTPQSIKELELSCRATSYWHNGKLEWIGNYKNGEREGKWKLYRENGKLEGIGNYKNGKLEGEWKWYHNNGKLEQIGNFKNGKQEGEWKLYRENGKLEGMDWKL
eukprot:TRINITY_DN1077_c0_g2_i3.p1 TRINITY_DN1077_c0_g2~~TRINITY_DN1077_c0_g2_i3.p1  ORF type:complete len:130 (-),score=15.54 TRINITY_DN1077_c0_g2_i3:55-444(-)